MTKKYRRGETITLQLAAPTGGWENVDFQVVLFRGLYDDDKLVVAKSECALNASNEYVVTLSSATTATMRSGMYNVEIVATANGSTGIAFKEELFTLEQSAYNTLPQDED